jgi:hypothetical protein
MHRYDGVDYRYRSGDDDREKCLGIAANILGFRPEIDGFDYSLNFFSGGTGVDDRLAVRCRFNASDWVNLISMMRLKSPTDALLDLDWVEDFKWLLDRENSGQELSSLCIQFVNANKREFQDTAGAECIPFFANESDVNSWSVVWVCNGFLNYLSFDQG